MPIRSPAPRIAGWLLAALVAGCAPATDRDRYTVGEQGTATFANGLSAPLFFGGCSHFDYEKRVGDAWVSQGPDLACVWEGLAAPVAPGAALVDPIRAREPGTWRLRYAVGAGCSETAPLDAQHCAVLTEITSNEFEVLDAGCVATGCSGQLCAEQPLATTCEWRPEYACYRDARCGRFGPDGACGWQPTAELEACLASASR